jgi:protein pelota
MFLLSLYVMKLLSIDFRDRIAIVQPQSVEDLWRLSALLESDDLVTAKTERKLKIGEEMVRKPLTLTVKVEKTELQGDVLRISGTTVEGIDEVPKNSHHTLTIQTRDTLTIQKEWLAWQLEKLKEEDSHPVLILLMDREEAVFAVLRREPEILSTVKGLVQKKGVDGGSPYYNDLVKELAAYDLRINPRHIIVASPAFFKEYVIQLLSEQLRKKTVAATISATGAAALSELVRRPEVKHVLQQERYGQETELVDRLMEAIHKEKAAWGFTEVKELASAGALQTLLVTTNFLNKSRQENAYSELASVLKIAEQTKTSVHVLDTGAASQIDKLGGIAAVKRW